MKIRVVLSLSLCILCGITMSAQTPLIESSVKKIADQPLPVQVISGKIHKFGATSEVVAELSSSLQTEIKSVELYLVVFHGDKIVGGEGWIETVPGAITRQTRLPFDDGDQAILMVDEVVTLTRTFKLAKSDISENVLHLIRNEALSSVPIQVSMLDLLSGKLLRVQSSGIGDFCTGAAQTATTLCQPSGGVASFSCSQSTQTFSFTCNSVKSTPSPVPTKPGS